MAEHDPGTPRNRGARGRLNCSRAASCVRFASQDRSITLDVFLQMPAYVSDYLPTFLDAIGMEHPQPDWAADGISLLPFLEHAAAQPSSEPLVSFNRWGCATPTSAQSSSKKRVFLKTCLT